MLPEFDVSGPVRGKVFDDQVLSRLAPVDLSSRGIRGPLMQPDRPSKVILS